MSHLAAQGSIAEIFGLGVFSEAYAGQIAGFAGSQAMVSQSATLALDHFTPTAKSAVAGAQERADGLKHVQVEPAHLLLHLLERYRGVAAVLDAAGANGREVLENLLAALRGLPAKPASQAYLSSSLLELLRRAEREAKRGHGGAVRVEELLIALSQEIRGVAGEVLLAQGLGPGAFRPHLGALGDLSAEQTAGGGTQGAGEAAGEAPLSPTERYSEDFCAIAREGEPVIGRQKPRGRISQILRRRRKNHPIVVGEPGVGKRTLLRGVARDLLDRAGGDARQPVMRRLRVDQLVAGAKLRGEIEARLRMLLRDLGEDSKGGVLVIEHLSELVVRGVVGESLADMLRPVLRSGRVQVLCTATSDGFRRLEEKDPSLIRLFTVVELEAPTPEQALPMVRGLSKTYEEHHGVSIEEGALAAAVRLAKRYVAERALPEAAVDLLDEAAARATLAHSPQGDGLGEMQSRYRSLQAQIASLADNHDQESRDARASLEQELATLTEPLAKARQEAEARKGAGAARDHLQTQIDSLTVERKELGPDQDARKGEIDYVLLPDLKERLAKAESALEKLGAAPESPTVGEAEIADTVELWTGVPVQRMLEGEAEKLLRMEERLGQRVVGQPQAVQALAKAVRRGRVGLRDARKPIGSFLFLGPSGVGKTELAKALAKFLFDDESAMTRLDMSEFMERHMAQRLVGAPVGYADSEQGGFLTEAVRAKPYSVLLFDEVEKAHGDVFNLLLQVLDDGRLTDGRGRLADFSNCVVLMTSNIGSQALLDAPAEAFEEGPEADTLRDTMLKELRAFFRPEFLNRLDDVLLFRPLSKADLKQVLEIGVRRLNGMLAQKSLQLELSPEAEDHLVELAYQPAFGARPLSRVLLKEIQDPLAETLLKAGFAPNTSLIATIDAGQLRFAAKN